MNFLDKLVPDQRTLIVSLPYRVGLYVSESDKSGGEHSDAEELDALERIITAYSQEVFGAETVQFVISETVRRRAEWPSWAKDLSGIEHDCYKVIDILANNVEDKELSAFKNHLIEIGESVALAFREYGDKTPIWQKIRMYFDFKKSQKMAAQAGVTPKNWEQFINISFDERRALRVVAKALGGTYI